MSETERNGQERHYSVVIEWDPEDRIFVATVPSLPGCATHGRTYEEAARQTQDAIDSWLVTAEADGTPAPQPRPLAVSVL